ncbi:MAG: hypothetical protein Kow00121_60650 [Elainellaceae cyanobacterium]
MPLKQENDSLKLDLDGSEKTEGSTLVSVGGKLPHCFPVSTAQLLDIIVALSPHCQKLDGKKRKAFRQELNKKLYNKTRPGFYWEANDSFHIAYAGQPGGAKTQHRWRIFSDDSLKDQITMLIAGTSLAIPQPTTEPNGKYTKEWGGLYLRSEAEIRIAEALDFAGVLFFANARGRVGLQDTQVSDTQLTGRVEVDFLIFHQGKCLSLEVDGQHHLAQDQSIRDYARDRVLLRSGVPTVRFTAKDCLDHPQQVVSETLAILKN